MNRPTPNGTAREGGVHTVKAVVLIVVLAAIGIAVLARSGSNRVSTTSATTHHGSNPGATSTTLPAPTTTTTVLPPSQVKVQVLNGVLTGNLATEWTAKLKSMGYLTEPPDNATAKVASSVIYILTPGYEAEAYALATAVGLPSSAVNTTIPPPATAPIPAKERSSANLVLIIGPDLAASG